MAVALLVCPLSLILLAPTRAPQLRPDVSHAAPLAHTVFGGGARAGPTRQRTAVSRMSLHVLDHSMFGDAVCAFAASGLSTCLLHPIDTIKTRLQSPAYAAADKLRSTPAAAVQSKHPESLFEHLYAGLASSMMKEAPDAAVYLAIYGSLSASLLMDPDSWWSSHHYAAWMLAGAAGDAAGSIFRLPAEVLCKRMQTHAGEVAEGNGVLATLASTPRGAWAASWAAILSRDVPFGGLQVAMYEQLHGCLSYWVNALVESAPDSYSDILAGALAGAFAAALTTPLDVLVTHTLTNDGDGGKRSLKQAAISARQLISEQGPGTLMRGIGLRTLYYAPAVGCFFGLYEYFRRTLEGGL